MYLTSAYNRCIIVTGDQILKRILVVCKGNRARSPMFEILLNAALAEKDAEGIFVESAGTMKEAAGLPAEKGAILALRTLATGRPAWILSQHRSRWIGDEDLDLSVFQTIYCMDPEVKEVVTNLNLPQKPEIILVNEEGGGVPNPYEKPQEAYQETLQVIQVAIAKIVATL